MADIAPQDTPRTLFPEMPRAEPPPGGESDSYRSLSMMAMAGFALAMLAAVAVVTGGLVPFAMKRTSLFFTCFVLFPALAFLVSAARGRREAADLARATGLGLLTATVLFGIGGLMAYSGSSPWMLGTWFWLVVVLAILVCVVARVQILASEGTLTGEPLARWGLMTAAFFGLIYFAYESSISLAVASQARAAALEYIDLLKRGDKVTAFLRTLPPERRLAARSGPVALAMVEKGHNVATSPEIPGEFSGFGFREYVRLLRIAGKDLTVTEKTCRSELSDKACRVLLIYRIDSDLVSFDLSLAMVGAEYVDPDTGSRQRGWRIEAGRSGVDRATPPVLKDAAGALLAAHAPAKKLAERWLAFLAEGELDAAFLLTLPESGRTGPAREAALKSPQRAAFRKGSFLDHKNSYFPDEKTKTIALTSLHGLFDPVNGRRSAELTIAGKIDYPIYDIKDNRVQVRFDVRGMTRLETGEPKYVYEFALVVEGPYADAPHKPDDFRVESLELVRAKELAPRQK